MSSTTSVRERAGRLAAQVAGVRYLKRFSRLGWREVSADAVAGTRYGHPYSWANAVAVGARRAPSP